MRQKGYFLIFFMITTVLVSIIGLVEQLDPKKLEKHFIQKDRQALLQAKEALISYAITYHETHPDQMYGYLPCPDKNGDGKLLVPDDFPCGTKDSFSVGFLPYVDLALERSQDSRGRCLWYIVSGTFKNNPASRNMNWDAPGQFRYFDSNQMGGIVAIIVAPNAILSGQSRGSRAQGTGGKCTEGATRHAEYIEILDNLPNVGWVDLNSTLQLGNDEVVFLTARDIFSALMNRSDFPLFLQDRLIETVAYFQTWLSSNRSSLGHITRVSDIPSSAMRYPLAGASLLTSNFIQNWGNLMWIKNCEASIVKNPGARACEVLYHSATSASGHNLRQCDSLLIFGGLRSDWPDIASASHPFPFDHDRVSYFQESAGVQSLIMDNNPPSWDLRSELARNSYFPSSSGAILSVSDWKSDLVFCI